jgi:uncharacterized membrane protein YraQ (UPF0718 family)
MTALAASFGRLRNVDPALAGLILGTALLAALAPDQAARTVAFVARNLLGVLPFLVASVALAAYAGASGADNLIARAFTGSLPLMIVLAALTGALSPFCSCGVIPIIAALLAMGVPLAPVMAFWLSSPLMDPSMFVLTAGTLGFGFALAKTIAAIGVGLLGGFGTAALVRAGLIGEPLRHGVGNGGCAGGKVRQPKGVVWTFWRETERRAKFAGSALTTFCFLGKWLAVAFFLESLMLAYVPGDLVARVAGDGGLGSIAIAAFVGVPAYLNGIAALPLVAGLMQQGMSGGAAMAFLVGGGVTSIPAAIAVAAIARPPVFSAYLAFATAGAVLSGIGYSLLG